MDSLKNGMTGKAGFHPVLSTWLEKPWRYLPTLHLTETRRAKSRHLPTCRISKLPSARNLRLFYHDPMWTILPSKDAAHLKVMLQSFSHPMLLQKKIFNQIRTPIANTWARHDNTYHKLPLQSRPISHQPSLPAAQWHVFLADVSGQWVPISRSGDSIFNLTCYWTKHFELEDLHCPRGTLEGLRLAKKSPRLRWSFRKNHGSLTVTTLDLFMS